MGTRPLGLILSIKQTNQNQTPTRQTHKTGVQGQSGLHDNTRKHKQTQRAGQTVLLNLVLSTNLGPTTKPPVKSSSRGSGTLFWPLWVLYSHAESHRDTNTVFLKRKRQVYMAFLGTSKTRGKSSCWLIPPHSKVQIKTTQVLALIAKVEKKITCTVKG